MYLKKQETQIWSHYWRLEKQKVLRSHCLYETIDNGVFHFYYCYLLIAFFFFLPLFFFLRDRKDFNIVHVFQWSHLQTVIQPWNLERFGAFQGHGILEISKTGIQGCDLSSVPILLQHGHFGCTTHCPCAMSKLITFVPWFSRLLNRHRISTSLWVQMKINEIVHVKYLAQCLAYSKYSVNENSHYY